MRNDRKHGPASKWIIIAVVSHCASIQGVQMMKQLNHSNNSRSTLSFQKSEDLIISFSMSQRRLKSLFSDIKITNKVWKLYVCMIWHHIKIHLPLLNHIMSTTAVIDTIRESNNTQQLNIRIIMIWLPYPCSVQLNSPGWSLPDSTKGVLYEHDTIMLNNNYSHSPCLICVGWCWDED